MSLPRGPHSSWQSPAKHLTMATEDILGTPRQALSRSEQGFENPTRRVFSSVGRFLDAAPTICGKWQLKDEAWLPRATKTIEYCLSGSSGISSGLSEDRRWRFLEIELSPISMLASRTGIGGTGGSSGALAALLASFSFLAARLPLERLIKVCRCWPKGLSSLSNGVRNGVERNRGRIG